MSPTTARASGPASDVRVRPQTRRSLRRGVLHGEALYHGGHDVLPRKYDRAPPAIDPGLSVRVVAATQDLRRPHYDLHTSMDIKCTVYVRIGFGTRYVAYLGCLLYTSPSPRDLSTSRMPSSA